MGAGRTNIKRDVVALLFNNVPSQPLHHEIAMHGPGLIAEVAVLLVITDLHLHLQRLHLLRQHTSAYVSTRRHTYSGSCRPARDPRSSLAPATAPRGYACMRDSTSSVNIRQHTSEYVSTRQHTHLHRAVRVSLHARLHLLHRQQSALCSSIEV
jgi:hypothetical protein